MVNMGTVWDRTAEFLSDNIAALTPVALLAFFVPASITGSLNNVAHGDNGELALVVQLIVIALSVVQLWGMLVVIALASEGGTPHDASRAARRRLLPALATTVLSWIAVMLLFLPLILVVVLDREAMAALAQPGTPVALHVPAGWGWPLAIWCLVATGLTFWLVTRLALTTPVVLREERTLGAFARSFALTRGIAWQIFGVILLFVLIAIVSVLAATLVFGSIFRLIAGDGDGMSLASVLTSVVSGVVQAAFTVLAAAFTAKLYMARVASQGRP